MTAQNHIPKPPAKCLALLGTGSDVGKSIVVTGICRMLRQAGIDVAPYKAQNMSNNSYVTIEGGEMGRAQVVQAQAAGVEPMVDMNPVLLKPCSDTGAQVILHGKAIGNAEAKAYWKDTDYLFGRSLESLQRLRDGHEVIVMEGAGSCAEVNLRDRDFVNFRMAHAADAPVIIVADIDRGGVFAQIVGTLDVVPKEDRERIKGFIINRFRGDARLFDDGIAWLEKRTGLPVLGLIPWFYHIEIDSEDGMPLDIIINPPAGPVSGKMNIAVVRLPHISNFTDFNPLGREACVNLHYLSKPKSLRGYDLVLLPGSKNVRFDLGWMRETGWAAMLEDYEQSGGGIGGICGGYQMLGKAISDPVGLEGEPGETAGLGFLDALTELKSEKILTRTKGAWIDGGEALDGYEIHMGVTTPSDGLKAVVKVESRNGVPAQDLDGARRADGRIWGTYLHGLFDEHDFRRNFLRKLCPDLAHLVENESSAGIHAFREKQYDLLAEHFRANLDVEKLMNILDL